MKFAAGLEVREAELSAPLPVLLQFAGFTVGHASARVRSQPARAAPRAGPSSSCRGEEERDGDDRLFVSHRAAIIRLLFPAI